jgi:hypothetical protein
MNRRFRRPICIVLDERSKLVMTKLLVTSMPFPPRSASTIVLLRSAVTVGPIEKKASELWGCS